MIFYEENDEGELASPSPSADTVGSVDNVPDVSVFESVPSDVPVSSVSPVNSSDPVVSGVVYDDSNIVSRLDSLSDSIDNVYSVLNILLIFAVFCWCFRRLEKWRENASVKRSSSDER